MTATPESNWRSEFGIEARGTPQFFAGLDDIEAAGCPRPAGACAASGIRGDGA